jgi:uncharacterized protein involved in outer membrane biogenesis
MKLRIRRRWLWLSGVVACLLGATALLSLSVDEPFRRYMEREINSRLTGYTVSVRAAHVHPWTVSLELADAAISQDANPDPPVARIRSLTAGLHWRALLHGKVVADITFDQPALYVNLKNLRAEAAGDVALRDRGWQRALEAVALDLKIDRLQVREGNLTYTVASDGGEPKTLGHRLYEGVLGLAAKVLKNRPRGEVATIVTI